MALTRITDWDTKGLGPYLFAHKSDPFVWGQADCCLFAANAIQSFTGQDLAADFRGKYTDEASAFALIREITGGNSVGNAAEYCATKAGLQEWRSPLLARRGDLVVIDNAGREIAGIIDLTGRFALSMAETGMIVLPLSAVKKAWKT